MDNKIKQARSLSVSTHKKSFHHAAVFALVRAFEALLTMNKDEILKAQTIAFRSAEYCEKEKVRYKGSLEESTC
jgi:hypothetical protein